jgi:hypothetical protein
MNEPSLNKSNGLVTTAPAAGDKLTRGAPAQVHAARRKSGCEDPSKGCSEFRVEYGIYHGVETENKSS